MKKKIISLMISFVLLQIVVINKSFAKSLPAGSGAGDIPANVLILLDKSGSMSSSMALGADLRFPNRITLGSDTDKNVIASPINTSNGLRNVSYSNALAQIGSTTSWTAQGDCNSSSRHVFLEQYNGNIFFFNQGQQGCSVNITTGDVTRFALVSNVTGGDLKDNFLYVFRKNPSQILIYDLDNNNQLHATCTYGGSTRLGTILNSSEIGGYERASFEIDKAKSYLFSVFPQGSKTFMERFNLASGIGSCPSEIATSSQSLNKRMRQARDIEMHPTKADTFLITRNFSVYEYNAASNSFGTGGTSGIGQFRRTFNNYSPNNINQIRFNKAYGIAVDVDNERIYIADKQSNKIQVFDKDFGFIKILGSTGQNQSRMVGAANAIKEITTDSNLTSGAHFGFGWWSSATTIWYTSFRGFGWPTCISQMAAINAEIGIDSSHWVYRRQGNGGYWCDIDKRPSGFSGWDNPKDKGIPCTTNNCLRVKVNREGAAKTAAKVLNVSPGGGTRASDFTDLATQYFNHPTESPRIDGASCGKNYVIIIGDGIWGMHSQAMTAATALKVDGIKTFSIAYGSGISATGLLNFDELAVAGGTDRVRIASDGVMLKEILNDIIGNIIADKVSFTAPSITAKVSEGGTLLQAQFQYVKREEWNGFIKKTKLNAGGQPIPNDPSNWEAHERMPGPDQRKIWTQLELSNDYKNSYNNVTETNSNELRSMFQRFGGDILDYHRDTVITGGGNTTRCSTQVASIEDGDEDDLKGLINFLRGKDYFDYNGDCNLTNTRDHYLGDVYNSDMLVVGKPAAESNFTSKNQEAYWRAVNDYNMFKSSKNNRAETIYVGANDGMLHAIDFDSGIEQWAFIPPFLFPQLAGLINPSFNVQTPAPAGGTNSIYGVDGSPVQHDILMYGIQPDGSRDSVKSWRTILMVPYGRGGAGFSVLDITDRDAPVHYYSVYNSKRTNTIYRMDHTGTVFEQTYLPQSFSLAQFPEAMVAAANLQADANVDTTCNTSGTTSCFKSWTWTLPDVFTGTGVAKSDLEVTVNEIDTTLFSIGTSAGGKPTITISSEEIFYQVASGPGLIAGQNVGIKIKSSSALTASSGDPDYDYSKLGETWSAPRIFRMPNSGSGDTNINDDIYVAVMGGGFGNEISGVGSGVYVINLEDTLKPFKIQQHIEIQDLSTNDVNNSVPGNLVVITPDNARKFAKFRGALVYASDYEGKITKINLTNMSSDPGDPAIELYDNYAMFDSQATKGNGRFMFHSMDATIGRKTKKLWLFAGTGDMNNLVDKRTSVNNILLGIADKDFPKYKNPVPTGNPPQPPTIKNLLSNCVNTANQVSPNCIDITTAGQFGKIGWYIELEDAKKVTAEPTVAGGVVYFPVYKPPADLCDLGPATMCAVDDECGTNLSSGLGSNSNDDQCHYVGKGILSKIVAFDGKLYANIAGEADGGKDLITKSAIGIEIEVGRNAWRQQQ